MEKEEKKRSTGEDTILGLSTNELAGLSVDEITGNKVAINMIMHYYKKLVDENNALKNEKNTYQTYVTAYNNKKSNAATGNILVALSNIFIGFGINLITSNNNWVGGSALFLGVALTIVGMYFTFFKERN